MIKAPADTFDPEAFLDFDIDVDMFENDIDSGVCEEHVLDMCSVERNQETSARHVCCVGTMFIKNLLSNHIG